MSKFIFGGAYVLAMAVTLAPAAQAEPKFYLGGGLAYSGAVSKHEPDAPLEAENNGNLTGLGVTGGVRFGNPGLFYGAEIDTDFNIGGELTARFNGRSCADGFAIGPYMCSQTATVRARAMIGTEVQGYELFGTLGYAVLFGDQAIAGNGITAPVSVGGITYGIGAQTAMGAGKIRTEVIWDNLETIISSPSTANPIWNSTTAKVSYIIEF